MYSLWVGIGAVYGVVPGISRSGSGSIGCGGLVCEVLVVFGNFGDLGDFWIFRSRSRSGLIWVAGESDLRVWCGVWICLVFELLDLV